MKHSFWIVIGLLIFLPAVAGAAFFDDDTAGPPCTPGTGASFETHFASAGKFSQSVVEEVASAKKSIRLVSRSFLSKPLSDALVKAGHSKVDIAVVLNRKTSMPVDSAAHFLATMSLRPHVTKNEDALYENYMVIDERDIVLGNFAQFIDDDDASGHAASELIIHNAPELAKAYLADWKNVWSASDEMKKDEE